MTVGIIGAGPTGLELAVALKGAGIDYLHFDAGQIGAYMVNTFTMSTKWCCPSARCTCPSSLTSRAKTSRTTAIAGSPQKRVQIIVDDCHVHVPRIASAIALSRAELSRAELSRAEQSHAH